MPLPLLPFLVKGAIVAGKAIAGKAAVAKGAAVVAKGASATIGASSTLALGAVGLVAIGGIAWSLENVERANRAYDAWRGGDRAAAGRHLVALATSVKTVGAGDFAGDLVEWVDDGAPLDPRVGRLARGARALAREAEASAEFAEARRARRRAAR